MGTIFVAGVHGVGKTTCCKEVSEQVGVPHYTASGIIKAERATAIDDSAKNVRDIKGNQELLVQGVRKILQAGEGKLFLDGHFTLLNDQSQIQTVELAVFVDLRIDGIAVFRDRPEVIQERLQQRDRRDWDQKLVAAHQDAEIRHATWVAASLEVPIVFLDAFNTGGLLEVATKFWDMRA